jgi:uncharacterized phage protein (TIGR02216 family)
MSPSSANFWRRPSVVRMGEGKVRAGTASETQTFPWRQAMAFGLGRLRLSSREFWAMTPRELAAAVEGVAGVRPAPIDRRTLDALMLSYPDSA